MSQPYGQARDALLIIIIVIIIAVAIAIMN